MPNYRRAYVPSRIFFFTVVTHRQREMFPIEANRTLLGEVIRDAQRDWPFMTGMPLPLYRIICTPSGVCHRELGTTRVGGA